MAAERPPIPRCADSALMNLTSAYVIRLKLPTESRALAFSVLSETAIVLEQLWRVSKKPST